MNPIQPPDPVDPRPVLTVQPLGWCVRVAPGQSLVEAARAAGVRLRSSCRNGTCRACLCRLVAGEVACRVDWPGLTAEERASGWILPCVALPLGDVDVEAVAELVEIRR
ncbi:2Fe-2S iron-sulfur cluster binding domain-containing protein [Sphaerotilus montanus]|uniref:Ferredoxin n=1 Tax=Sphaerotilus montanus TaxID=522889 RepID=A0A7Y9UAE8_9BURK|nr:2Fe-2S iron-sulfur cluster-binding protein [Sphaerotilus montanus]NYG31364.1 ferredoxin [Sphaerotilus montanus]NZD55345.1 2Fe-2S iron-sulfur cluster binding domain-containing protein [Sphaerotilus montanus]